MGFPGFHPHTYGMSSRSSVPAKPSASEDPRNQRAICVMTFFASFLCLSLCLANSYTRLEREAVWPGANGTVCWIPVLALALFAL